MTDTHNGNGDRTHEPSLRELTSELDGLRELSLSKLTSLREFIDERDRLYKERDDARKTAVDAALAAAKEAVSAALLAADRAVAKVEVANEKRFEAVNEFRGQLADQAATFLPRSEANIRFEGLTEKNETLRTEVQDLRESRSYGSGGSQSDHDNRQQLNWLVGIAVGAGGIIVGIIIKLLP